MGFLPFGLNGRAFLNFEIVWFSFSAENFVERPIVCAFNNSQALPFSNRAALPGVSRCRAFFEV
jgi:hypothetical protein